MKLIGRRTAVIAVTTVFGLSMLGSAAFAALAPAATNDTVSVLAPEPGANTLTEAPRGNKLKDVLDALVSKGVITQQQEDAILAALKDKSHDRDREELLRRIFAGLFQQSATYLGVQPADLKAKLPGTSLGAIANATAGKSRDGLVTTLVNAVNDAIAKAVADGKITQEQADKAKASVPERVAKFVDHTWPTPKPRLPSVRAFIGDVMSDARAYLGIAQKDLMTQLRAGKSLGEIADATPGKSKSGLVSTLMNDANAKIDKAKQDGKLTADQATQLKSKVQEAVTQIVDHKGPAVKSH